MGKRNRKYFVEHYYPVYFVKDFKPDPPVIFEEIKDINIKGVKENHYTVSNLGIVKNKNGQQIYPATINSGYDIFRLTNGLKGSEKKYKHISAHRLVKQVFDPIDNFGEMTVNHINMNKHDNRLVNLEYLTQAENNAEKDKTFFNDGTANAEAFFNRSQLKYIVSEIDKGEKHYSEILKDLGLEVTKNNCDYVGNIKRGITYKREVQEIRKELRAQRLSREGVDSDNESKH